MEKNVNVNDRIRENRLFFLNSFTGIKKLLGILKELNIKKIVRTMDDYYETMYIKKSINNYKSKKEKYDYFLSVDRNHDRMYKSIPLGDNKNEYRSLIRVKEPWVKKSQRKLNKILSQVVLTKKIRGQEQVSVIHYLHSSVKKRSYETNASEHLGDKYVFMIDIKDFYPSVTREKLFDFFRIYFKLNSDIAMFYSVFSTCKNNNGKYVLAQGLSQSSILAYLVNHTLFDYIYELASKYGITMTLYVDDLVFSSTKQISQEFIDKLFGLFKRNDMSIKKSKIHSIRDTKAKKITGVYIKGNKSKVPNRKHEEFEVQYNFLSEEISNINTFQDYFDFYNIYLKFYGNYQFIKTVEKRVPNKFEQFILSYDKYFPKGINKKDKSKYSSSNVLRIKDRNKLNTMYQKLKNHNKLSK